MNERFKGVRNAALAAILVTACGAPKPTEGPTPQPTPKPTELVTPMPTPSQTEALPTPTGTVVVTFPPTASPVATASPTRTPEATSSPTPEATPTTLQSIIADLIVEADGNYANVSEQEVSAKIEAVLNDSEVANTVLPPTTQTIEFFVNDGWKTLKTGKGPSSEEGNRLFAANSLIRTLFTGYDVNKNADIFTSIESNGAIELVLDFAYNHMEQSTFDQLIEGLSY